MVEIEFNDNGRIIKGILLGKYQRQHDEIYSFEKKFLWKTKRIYKKRQMDTTLYVIFIPWKHKEKEIVEIDEKYIVTPELIHVDETWIKIDNFISKSFDSYIYHAGIEVNDFIGYRFIYENNSFIINMILHESWDNLTILYKNVPEILEVDLNNIEE